MRAVLLCVAVAALAAPARSQEAAVDEARVRACFDGAAIGDTQPDCIGAASNACQQAPGGQTTPAIAACIAAETAAWDAILNDEYRATRAILAGGSDQAIDTEAALLAAQRAWIAYRDAECDLAYARWHDGTIRSIVGANCHLVFTATRAIELRDMRGEG